MPHGVKSSRHARGKSPCAAEKKQRSAAARTAATAAGGLIDESWSSRMLACTEAEHSMRKRIIVAAAVILGATAAMIWVGRPVPPPAKELVLDLGNKVTMKLVGIRAGKFTMGSPESEKRQVVKDAVAAGASEDDAKKVCADEIQHEVKISKPFYIAVTPVTVDQFAVFAKESGYKTDAEKAGWSLAIDIKDGKLAAKQLNGCSWLAPSFDQKGDHPVVQVSWNDAQAFCQWLSKKTGKTVVLPTEAQWEYACRAGTNTAYPWGDNPETGEGWDNCADQSLKKVLPSSPANLTFFSWYDDFVFTSPVASFKANAWGLYDMNGNVWNWCSDGYGEYKKGTSTDPPGVDASEFRVLRGGSWGNGPAVCRSACRHKSPAALRTGLGGFRVVVLASSVD
jgi:formylglycine-generating enzyme required for sulfatase activity